MMYLYTMEYMLFMGCSPEYMIYGYLQIAHHHVLHGYITYYRYCMQ